jgi:death-on-curing protein
MRYLTSKNVEIINRRLIERYSPGEQVGVKEPGLLESAVHRPQQSVFTEDAYSNLFSKAAALFESLGQNHPFFNGNKRTAFTAMVMFLKINGYGFKMNPVEAEDFTVNMVNHNYSLEDIASIIKDNTYLLEQ